MPRVENVVIARSRIHPKWVLPLCPGQPAVHFSVPLGTHPASMTVSPTGTPKDGDSTVAEGLFQPFYPFSSIAGPGMRWNVLYRVQPSKSTSKSISKLVIQ